MKRRLIACALAWSLLLLALVPVARWEAGRHARAQIAGMRWVLDEIGPIAGRSLAGYRVLPDGRVCLTYRRGREPFALEFCVDPEGRVTDAYDRRSGTPRFWSLHESRPSSTLLVPRTEVLRILRRHGVDV